MAKLTNSTKITFGTKNQEELKNTYNKSTPRPKAYRGQGR